MDQVYILIKSSINYVIAAAGIYMLIKLVMNAAALSHHLLILREADNRMRRQSSVNKKTREVQVTEEEDLVTPDTVREYEKDFNKTYAQYNALAALIPIFPLLGILGTVAGLILQVQAASATADGANAILSSLHLAMTSTFAGLLCAIILKVVAVLACEKKINEAEIWLDDYNKKFSNALAWNSLKADEE